MASEPRTCGNCRWAGNRLRFAIIVTVDCEWPRPVWMPKWSAPVTRPADDCPTWERHPATPPEPKP